MNYLIITFPNHEVYTYYKLVVDNFSSFTELGQLPNWYESSLDRNARRARCVRSRIRDPRRKVRYSGEFGSLSSLPWAPAGPGTYPQDIHRIFIIREFGSLKVLDTDRGPRAVPHITRVQYPRCFGLGPWFCSHETI